MKSPKVIQFLILFLVLSAAGAVIGYAAQYDIKEMTPAVEQAISSRQSRYGQLQALKADGVLGENKQGYVEVRNASGNAYQVAADENADRKVIYQTIADQNQLGAEGLNLVETVFAEVQREKARTGDALQQPDGAWTKK